MSQRRLFSIQDKLAQEIMYHVKVNSKLLAVPFWIMEKQLKNPKVYNAARLKRVKKED